VAGQLHVHIQIETVMMFIPTPCCRVSVERFRVAWLVKKFHACMGSERFSCVHESHDSVSPHHHALFL
jgi:hypothetical protein